MASSVVQWVSMEMSKLLGVEANESIATYILSMDSRKELEEYMCELMDVSEPDNRKFINELLSKWRPPNASASNQGLLPDGVTVYKKSDTLEDEKYAVLSDKVSKGKKKGKSTHGGTGETKSPQNSPRSQSSNTSLKTSPPRDAKTPIEADKKKSKFVPLFSAEGDAKTVAKLPGRHPCECQAAKHPLISNCVRCGRIVCEQEGSGPCLFCGTLVCTKDEREILNRGSRKSEKLRSYLMSKENGEVLPNAAGRVNDGLDQATKHRDKLLEYDRNSVKRTQVIDDESDYFSTGPGTWLSKKEKEMLRRREEELRAIRHASRKDRKITLDFAGRQVVDAPETVDMYNVNDAVVQEVHYGMRQNAAGQEAAFTADDFDELINPNIEQAPKFDAAFDGGSEWGKSARAKKAHGGAGAGAASDTKNQRIQDREYQEMVDTGVAMSMHQPWASLLVAGIKVHEGRSWYTAHRGRLWIASTVKQPEPREVAELEQQYRVMYNKPDLPFPESYPVGCLLGCVDVTDCLARDDYVQKFPDGESGSSYVFICESPQELMLKFPMKGKHKIYKLDPHNHNAAKKGMLKQNASNR